jgi:hypothetical protein
MGIISLCVTGRKNLKLSVSAIIWGVAARGPMPVAKKLLRTTMLEHVLVSGLQKKREEIANRRVSFSDRFYSTFTQRI